MSNEPNVKNAVMELITEFESKLNKLKRSLQLTDPNAQETEKSDSPEDSESDGTEFTTIINYKDGDGNTNKLSIGFGSLESSVTLDPLMGLKEEEWCIIHQGVGALGAIISERSKAAREFYARAELQS